MQKEIIKNVITNSDAETRKVAHWFISKFKFKKGMIIGLIGDLGSGKTAFTKGIAEGMRLKGLVTSPSFNILNIYQRGGKKLFHFDLYRLNSIEELENIGYEEYFYNKGITVIEWADKCMDILTEDCYLIYFKYQGEKRREITICRK
ncbi:MAG: tRNA (adenosine(37)-N6)-threonylcarbamoyltransferase complex ATPase subunit type 1 TsaE [Spirochaetes bacterium]|nr:tRNA (adenosine(37)-N6)-threonylcarbamoyltransferase complex ATPase subunit type 1 TsaE [Spirochaetota bacterium]